MAFPLVSLEDVTRLKAIDPGESSRDAQFAVEAAVRWILWRVGRDPRLASFTRRASGGGYERYLFLQDWPIVTITTLVVDGTNWLPLLGASDEDSGQRAMLGPHGHSLISRYCGWPAGSGNIQVAGTAGFTAPELEHVRRAGAMVAWLLLSEGKMIGQGAQTMGGVSVQEVVRNAKDYQFIEEAIRSVSERPF